MRKLTVLLFFIIPLWGSGQNIITDDVDKFWLAYDKIIQEKDSIAQLNLIKSMYIEKGTKGLDGIIRARRYTAEEYVYAINHYPKFWQSVRQNTLQANQLSKEINEGVAKLKDIYPTLKPVNIYFEIGVLRTGGTTIDDMLLIGSEIALTDKNTITSELDARYPHLRSYFDTNPKKDVVFLNIHEYIHTQQKETIGNTLLSQTIMEGIAEFLAEVALNKKSPNPQIDFGFKNEAKIKAEYEKEMFSPNIYNWIMNNPDNQFGMRDLGYFVGYAICKKYYEMSPDKKLAVKQMIELDYNKEAELIKFVEKTNYFQLPLNFYKQQFENARPKVIGVEQLKASQNISAGTKLITLNFSKPMFTGSRGFDYGPLGEENLLRVEKVIGFSEDRKSFSFEVKLLPNKKYQSVATERFMDENGFPIPPYIIEFTTTD